MAMVSNKKSPVQDILIESQWNLNTESGSAPAVSCLY